MIIISSTIKRLVNYLQVNLTYSVRTCYPVSEHETLETVKSIQVFKKTVDWCRQRPKIIKAVYSNSHSNELLEMNSFPVFT